MTTWTISINWDRDDDYLDSYDDVTDRVISAEWSLGLRVPYQEVANESTLDLVLNNEDRRFSPEYSSSPLAGKVLPFRPIRIQSNDGATTRTHWLGWIEAIQPAVNQYGQRITKILASGALQFYKATETHMTLQEHKRTDKIIAELIKEVVIPPALSHAWVLGRVGNSEVGRVRLADTPATAVSLLPASSD